MYTGIYRATSIINDVIFYLVFYVVIENRGEEWSSSNVAFGDLVRNREIGSNTHIKGNIDETV